MTAEEFREYVTANRDRFLRFTAGYSGRPEDAEDVLQDVLLRLWGRCDQITLAAANGYVFQTLRNALVDDWRCRRPERRGAPAGSLAETAERPAHTLEARPADLEAVEGALVEALQRVRADMTALQRVVFAAFLRVEGRQAEARDLPGFPSRSTYPNALHKAKLLLRSRLGAHWALLTYLLGARRLRELLGTVFCDRPEDLPNEDER